MQIRKKIFPAVNYDHEFLGYCRGKNFLNGNFRLFPLPCKGGAWNIILF